MSKNHKVFLGVGHSGSPGDDPGAIGINGIREADLTLKTALYAKKELLKYPNVDVKLSREKNEYDPIGEEIKECNAYGADIAVDVHYNAADSALANGFEAIVYSKGGDSLRMGLALEKRMVEAGRKTRGCKTRLNSQGQDFFGFLREIKCPSIIAEMEFVTSEKIKDFDDEHEQEKWGKVLAWAILDYLGIPITSNGTKPPDLVIPSPNPSTGGNNSSNTQSTKTITATETTVYYDGADVKGLIINGTTHVPVRLLCDMLALNVDFRDKQVYITK